MKNIVFPAFLIAALMFASGCSEKFKVAAPYKNITAIYGFLDMNDTAHYIRVQKAFLDQNKNALSMATTPDSSFYAHLNVRIERINFLGTGGWTDTIHLNRVDLDLEGYPKQPGVFFQSPNYAYKFTNTLDQNFVYRIVVTNLSTGEIDSADAPIISEDPNNFHIDIFDDTVLNKGGMDFSSTLPGRFFEFTGYYLAANGFTFEGSGTPVYLSQAIIRFNWTDSNALTQAMTTHYYDYNLGYSIVGSNAQMDYKIKNVDLYNAVSLALGNAPANTFRLLGRCDVFVYLGTSDFNNYLQASLTQGTGLTGSEIEPIYSNIKGANTVGLYTSRAMRTDKITITYQTVDSLMNNAYLAPSKIAGTSYHQ